MAAQMDYGYGTPKGVAGGKVDLVFDEAVTRKNEEKDGILKFGMAVMVGTTPGLTVKIPTDGCKTEQIEGIVLHHANTEQDMKGNVVVRENASISILKKGHVWGRLASDVVPKYGEKAYVVVTGEDAGCFTNTADSNVDIGATFGTETDAGIAVIEINK